MPKEECEHLGNFEKEIFCKLDDHDDLECEHCPDYSPYNDRCKTCRNRYICFDTHQLACDFYKKERDKIEE